MAVGFAEQAGTALPSRVRPRIAAIVLNWNRAGLTCRAVASLHEQDGVDLSVFVVDNGSAGDDVATISTQTSARVIALPENAGFARAVNAGAIAALRSGAPYLLLFNNDAHVDADSPVLARLAEALDEDPTLGAAGAVIGNDDDAMSVQSQSYRLSLWFPIAVARKRAATGDVTLARGEYLSGSCLLVRASAFAAVGGFDPDFFFYGDDVDLARRLQAAGFGLRLLGVRGVRHARGASIRVGSPEYAYVALRSHLILIAKHARAVQRPSAYATLLAATAYLSLCGLLRGNARVALRALTAWRDFATKRWGGFDGARLEPAMRPSASDLR